MIYGYARISTTDQDLAIQHAALTAAGCTEIRAEKVSGTSRTGRVELDALLTFMRKGDTLMVTRIDRPARSIGDLQDIVRALKAEGVALKATEQHRHVDRGRRSLPRHAGRLRRVRDEPAPGKADGGHRQGEGRRRLQASQAGHRRS